MARISSARFTGSAGTASSPGSSTDLTQPVCQVQERNPGPLRSGQARVAPVEVADSNLTHRGAPGRGRGPRASRSPIPPTSSASGRKRTTRSWTPASPRCVSKTRPRPASARPLEVAASGRHYEGPWTRRNSPRTSAPGTLTGPARTRHPRPIQRPARRRRAGRPATAHRAGRPQRVLRRNIAIDAETSTGSSPTPSRPRSSPPRPPSHHADARAVPPPAASRCSDPAPAPDGRELPVTTRE